MCPLQWPVSGHCDADQVRSDFDLQYYLILGKEDCQEPDGFLDYPFGGPERSSHLFSSSFWLFQLRVDMISSLSEGSKKCKRVLR